MTRVLVVEDQRAFAAQLKHELGALGWSVSLVTTAEDCFRAAASEPPSVVLVSADLAPVSGINLCNGLKRDPKLRHVPLVIMATKPDASLESHRKLPTRADHYVRKSEDARELAERLKQLFAAEQPAVSQPPASHAAASVPPTSRKPSVFSAGPSSRKAPGAVGTPHTSGAVSAAPQIKRGPLDLELDMPPTSVPPIVSVPPREETRRPRISRAPDAELPEDIQIAELETEKAALERDKARLEKDKARLEEENAELEDAKDTLEDDKAALERKHAQLEERKAALEAEKATLEKAKAELEEEKAALEAKVSTLEAQVRRRRDAPVSLRGASSGEVERLRKSFEEELEDQQAVWSAALAHARQAQAAAVERAETAEQTMRDVDERLRELVSENRSLAARVRTPTGDASAADLARALADRDAAHERELADRDAAHERDLIDLSEAHAAEVKKLKARIKELGTGN